MDKLNRIYTLKKELNNRRPLSQSEIKRIRENYVIKIPMLLKGIPLQRWKQELS